MRSRTSYFLGGLVAAIVLALGLGPFNSPEPATSAENVVPALATPTVESLTAELTAARTEAAQAHEAARYYKRQLAAVTRGRTRDLFVPSGNREIARAITRIYYRMPPAQFRCLDTLWGTRESGWYHRADNPTSDAYGIPQSLPGSKMSAFGADWRSNPVTQVAWGISYIRGRYGSPCNALAFSTRNGHY